jgi:hypothetical protein
MVVIELNPASGSRQVLLSSKNKNTESPVAISLRAAATVPSPLGCHQCPVAAVQILDAKTPVFSSRRSRQCFRETDESATATNLRWIAAERDFRRATEWLSS